MKLELAEDDRPPAELTLEEYLHSSFSPDCDFVDGRTEERNIGTMIHSLAVTGLIMQLFDRNDPECDLPLPSVRTRVSPTRIRVPDIAVVPRRGPKEQIVGHPPLAIFEILDPEDRFAATIEKLRDYDRFGVKHIWVIDPDSRIVYRFASEILEETHSGELTVPGTPIRVILSELFAELDHP